jgi:hypothetical protein
LEEGVYANIQNAGAISQVCFGELPRKLEGALIVTGSVWQMSPLFPRKQKPIGWTVW